MKTRDEESEDFIRDYFRKVDTAKVSSIMEFYSPDASVIIGSRRFSGIEEIKPLFTKFFKRMAKPKHELRNIKVETSGYEVIVTCEIRSKSYVRLIAKDVTLLGGGKFWILFDKGKWKIVEHDISVNLSKTFLKTGPLNFLNLFKIRDQFNFLDKF